MFFQKKYFSAISILTGTIIGAGMFGIPYVVSRVGFSIGILYLVLLGIVVTLVTLAFGEIVARTKKRFQMTGYAKKYLGSWGQGLMSFSLIFGTYGALLAYTIAIGNFLNIIFSPIFGGTSFIYSIIFYILGSLAILFGLGIVEKIENAMVLLLLFIVGLIALIGFREIDVNNLIGFSFGLGSLFLPYGVILFSYTGASIVPEMADLLIENKKKLKSAIIISMLISFVVYALFALVVFGISGGDTSEEAITGLEDFLGHRIIILGAILGILTIATSFFSLGLVLKHIFKNDYSINNFFSWILACIIPLIIFILGIRSFVMVIDLVGIVSGGLQGILILMMFQRVKKKSEVKPVYSLKLPKFLIYILYLIFGGGIVYEIFYNIVAKIN